MLPIWYFIMNFTCIYISYPIIEIYLTRNYDKFDIYDRKRKNYIIKNYMKSKILNYISIATIPLIPFIIFDIGNITKCCHFLGFLYTAGDTGALIKDINMSLSTKIHHSITTCFGFLNTTIDFGNAHSISKMLALYCILSCYSYDVNYCLGMRFLVSETENINLKKKAYLRYLMCCCVNWSLHIIYLLYNIKNMEIVVIAYFSLIGMIVYDDIVLLKWLQD